MFRGGFDKLAADRIAGASLLLVASLVEKSLIQASSESRYSLHEVIRHYARGKLGEVSEEQQTADRHLDYFTELAETAASQLRGHQQGNWLNRLELEHDNLRGALGWGRKRRKIAASRRLGGALGVFWRARGHISEG